MSLDRIGAFRRPSLSGAAVVVAPLIATTVSERSSLFVAALFAVAFVAAMIVGPGSAVGAAAAVIPLVFVTVHVGATEWSVLELALVCMGSACGVEMARLAVTGRSRYLLSRLLILNDVTVLATAIAVVGVVSLTWVADVRAIESSERELRRVILEPLVVILALRLSPVVATRRLVAQCLVLAGGIVSAIAFGQIVFRSSGVEVGSVFRPIGTYPHPNNLALFLERVTWLPLALAGHRARGQKVGTAATVVIALACAATLSRGAVIALVLGGIVWLILSRRRVRVGVVAAAGCAAVGLVLLSRRGGDGTESLGSRTKIWAAAVDMLRDHPVTGIGLDQFYQLYGTRYVDPSGWAERYTSHPHDLVLDFWLRLGIPGLLILCGVGWSVSRRLAAQRRTPSEPVAVALLAGLVGGLGHGLIDNSFFLPDLATFLWLALALAGTSDGRDAAR